MPKNCRMILYSTACALPHSIRMYIVMEHCAGGTLADIMPGQRVKGSDDADEKWKPHAGAPSNPICDFLLFVFCFLCEPLWFSVQQKITQRYPEI